MQSKSEPALKMQPQSQVSQQTKAQLQAQLAQQTKAQLQAQLAQQTKAQLQAQLAQQAKVQLLTQQAKAQLQAQLAQQAKAHLAAQELKAQSKSQPSPAQISVAQQAQQLVQAHQSFPMSLRNYTRPLQVSSVAGNLVKPAPVYRPAVPVPAFQVIKIYMSVFM